MNFFAGGTGELPVRPGATHHQSQHCVLFAVDIAGFTDRRRDDQVQLAVRRALYALVSRAFDDCLLGWDQCLHEDRGDGMLVIIPARMPSATVIDPLLTLLRQGLRRHNRVAAPANLINLRAAVHIGEVHRDDHGLAGVAVNHLFRMLDAPVLKDSLAESGGELALITSGYFFESVVRHGHGAIDPATYWPATVVVKQTTADCWVHLPHAPYGTPVLHRTAAPEPHHGADGGGARDVHGTVLPGTERPGPHSGIAVYGNVTVSGDFVAGDKIVNGDGG